MINYLAIFEKFLIAIWRSNRSFDLTRACNEFEGVTICDVIPEIGRKK